MKFYPPPPPEPGSLVVQLEAIAQTFLSSLDEVGFDEQLAQETTPPLFWN
jgi:hypothetical protein